MTRINLVPPTELTDQHLFAEFREIKMVPKALARSLKTKTKAEVLASVPKEFTLNTGHVKFFYDKAAYLVFRYDAIKCELEHRGINFNKAAELDPDDVFMNLPSEFWRDYKPTTQALQIIRNRIAEKIALKPDWYRHTKKW
jgi:deoxyribonuclease (pyrimidine dimer)